MVTELESITKGGAGTTAGLMLGAHLAGHARTKGQVSGQFGSGYPSGQHGMSSAMAAIDKVSRAVASAMETKGADSSPTTARIVRSLPKIFQ